MWGLSYFKTPYNSHMGKQIENERLLLGRRIRSLRNIKGWTQEELGRQADLSYKFIGEIERGQQNSSFDTLVKIAIALKVEILELFRYEQETVDITAIENRIGRIMKTHYEITVTKDENTNRATAITWEHKEQEKPVGVYCLRSNRVDFKEQESGPSCEILKCVVPKSKIGTMQLPNFSMIIF